jgi:hypothetical protein
MEDRPAKKVSPFWHSDVPGILVFLFGPLVIGILAAVLLPTLNRLRHMDAWTVFGIAVAVGGLGVILLFVARLPLYRDRQFLAFGPRLLDVPHRKLYWLSYCFVGVSVLLLLGLVAWLRT